MGGRGKGKKGHKKMSLIIGDGVSTPQSTREASTGYGGFNRGAQFISPYQLLPPQAVLTEREREFPYSAAAVTGLKPHSLNR